MKKTIISSAIATAVLMAPSIASAQEEGGAEPFIGLSGGYHDLGVGGDIEDAGGILGVVAGVDVPVSDNLFVGAEANYHFGTDAIDNEFGASARIGIKSGGSKFYLRGGYQEVDLDLEAILDTELPDGLEDSEGDFLVGAGAELPIGGDNAKVRFNLDTISFDSVRATAGVVFSF